jgi:hypothetical protein
MVVAVSLAIAGVAQAQNVSRTKRGDTAVVVTQGNGRWGAPHDAIEILRVPGDTKETTFGAAYYIEATPDGGVLVHDSKGEEGEILRRFDANGKFMHNLGRSGRGPGEYHGVVSFTARPDGSVIVRNDMFSVSIFGRDGKLVNSFALNFGNGSTNDLVAATDGSIYLRAPFTPASGPSSPGLRPMLHYDKSGKLLDSVVVTARWLPLDAPGYEWWRMQRDGRIVFGRSDKLGFLMLDRNGRNRLIGEVAAAPVAYLPDERRELQAARDLFRDKCGRTLPGQPSERVIVPETKLPARNVTVDVDGRIWILKSTTAEKIPPKVISSCSSRDRGIFKQEATYEEPPVYAGFLPDGTYLGEVRFPLRARVTFVGNTAWALVPDADDVQTLVKYRLY